MCGDKKRGYEFLDVGSIAYIPRAFADEKELSEELLAPTEFGPASIRDKAVTIAPRQASRKAVTSTQDI